MFSQTADQAQESLFGHPEEHDGGDGDGVHEGVAHRW